jgi:hypothetical protein
MPVLSRRANDLAAADRSHGEGVWLDGRETTITWDAMAHSGRSTPAGVYLVRVESGAGEAVGSVAKTR